MDDVIRVAQPADYDAIAAVVDDWWGRPMVALLPRLFLDHFWSTSRVSVDDRGLTGFLVGFVSPSVPTTAYIHFVGVRPDKRRSGLADRFYEEFRAVARDHGCRRIHAVTSPGNAASIAFHQALGFRTSAVRTDYDGRGQARVVFEREL